MNWHHMIEGAKGSSNFTLVSAFNAAKRLPPAVVSGPSLKAFKQSLGDDDPGTPTLS